MGLNQWLDYSGDNEPQDDHEPTRSPHPPHKPKWWETPLGCGCCVATFLGIIVFVLWRYFDILP
jgi:hypothetical protein